MNVHDDVPLIPAPAFRVADVKEALQLSFLAAGAWLQAVRKRGGTPAGYGCRQEGPHGPTPCGSATTGPESPECDCGCSAFEDCCPAYLAWYQAKYPPQPAEKGRL